MLQLNALINLGADAEAKTINDKQYISFRGASTEKKNGQDEVTWISVLAGYNENLLPFLKKGQQVFVSGRLKAGIYQSNNSFGIYLSVFAQTLQLCGGKKEETASSNQAPYGSTVTATPGSNAVPTQQTVLGGPQTPPFQPQSNDDDALPF
jgi:single-stranded DNA-binding protein